MRKEINSTSQLVTFQKTKAHSIILDFIQKVNFIESSNLPKSTQVNSVLAILSSINSISDSIFPLPDSQRYGNKAFKLVFDEIVNQHSSSSQDLSHYIQFSFGDPIRLDYGTGHELNFIAFLYGSLTDSDLSWVRHIFTVYLKVVRSIIARFKLEPAGVFPFNIVSRRLGIRRLLFYSLLLGICRSSSFTRSFDNSKCNNRHQDCFKNGVYKSSLFCCSICQ